MLILGEQQLEALEVIKSFLKSKETAFSLIGYAGTGKTLMIKSLVSYLENNFDNYVLCAPTHKAKVVLERFTEREGMTLHKLLSLSPNIEILDLDFKDLVFQMMRSGAMFPKKSTIICDESSMINDELFDLLIQKCVENNSKVILVGDKAQLQPVLARNYSKVFNLENQAVLTHIYRQNSESGLSPILPILRENIIKTFQTDIKPFGSVICENNVKDLFSHAVPYFKKAIENTDILEAKMLAFTNKRVNSFNKKMHELLFNNNEEYNQFEFLTGKENLEFDGVKFWNSMDYIVMNQPEKIDIDIFQFGKLPGYKLDLYDSSSKSTGEIMILQRDTSFTDQKRLAELIEDVRISAITAKNNHQNKIASNYWKTYFKILGCFTIPFDLYYENRIIRKKSFDYGYACTIHTSQGSSINNVFVDMVDVGICREEEALRQLQYVALSRTKQNAFILQ